jgi:HlyD family secretion protein
MDKPIEDKHWIKKRYWAYIAGGVLFIGLLLFLFIGTSGSSLRVEKERITIDDVIEAPFQDYIRVIGNVEPISVIYLDAISGGIVENILIDEGNMVKRGDIILKLTNTNLSLNILESESQLAEKSNFLRETQITMEQEKLTLQRDLLNQDFELARKKRTFLQSSKLYDGKLISEEDYLRSKEDYELSLRIRNLILERYQQDSIFRKVQVEKITHNLENMQRNLELIYKMQDQLNIKAPVDGQLGQLNAEIGQSIPGGQRIGQINVLTAFKVMAEIDEHYIDRIKNGLTAYMERQEDTFALVISKVYPEVHEGRFKTEFVFKAETPENIRTGQTYHISLQLGETQQAILLPRGAFFQSTGGQWIYVISSDGKKAEKRMVSIGRQNPQYYEVLKGLKAGEKVITSGYENFGNNESLILQ